MKIAVIDTSTAINVKHIKAYHLFDSLKISLLTTIYVLVELTGEKAISETRDYFRRIVGKTIQHVELSIDDLVEMAKVPDNKRISDAELSCLVKAKNFGCKTLCDDAKAVRYASQYISVGEIIGIKQLLIISYCKSIIGDNELTEFQMTLAKNKFCIPGNLCYDAAQARFSIESDQRGQ